MKNYVKPELFYERYELSQHIADCAWEFVNSADEFNCALSPDPNKVIDVSETLFYEDHCDLDVSNYGGYCYQGGTDGFNSFMS